MKTSWSVGLFQLYIVILFAEMMVTGSLTLGNLVHVNLSTVASPAMTTYSSAFLGALAVVTNVANVVLTVISVAFLWAPSIWTDWMLWIYYIICLPIALGTIISLVMAARGVSSAG